MNDSAGHSLIGLPDYFGDLFWHPVVPQTFPEGLPVNAIKRLFNVNEVDILRRIPLKGLCPNDAQGCDLIRARFLISEACLLVMEMRVYCVFHLVQQDAMKHFFWDGQLCDSS
ncbi:hypothetical protein DPMN_179772 [Dreissena polymorpha]|uniref:Uncharacterized protein n=1 Tax=Dreissena polymorpha TaxID=45954 RepID=A0A9D4EDF7_DREPO|nr:hypothetical protein DPMN_179772 [Dreissena polymorpha]